MPLPRLARPTSLVLAAAAVLALSGCAGAASSDPASVADGVTIDNCGTEIEVTDAAPERIVTIKSTSTELLLALGLGDRIVGTAFQDGPVPDRWADTNLPVISDFAPSQESVLALEPDFVFAGWESMLTAEAAGDRATLAELGVGSYVAPAACTEPGYKPEKLAFDQLFSEIEQAGVVFHAAEEAAGLVNQQTGELADIRPDERGLTALWWSSGTDTPYVGAGIGAPQMMMEQLGLTNIAGDLDDSWSSLSWESIVDADPDVIVLVDASWNTATSKIDALRANPATATLSAVVNDRYLTIPFAAGEAGVRTVEATADLATQLSTLTVK